MKTVSITSLLTRAENTGKARLDNSNKLFLSNGEAFLFAGLVKLNGKYTPTAIDAARNELKAGERLAEKYEKRAF